MSHLYCLLAVAIWSSLELTGKLVGAEINPFALTAWRFIFGGLALLPLALRNTDEVIKKLSKSSILHIGSLGILNVCVSMLLLQLAIYYGKASLSAVIVGMNPLFVSVFAMLLLKEKLNLPQIFSLVCGLLGLGLIIAAEKDLGSPQYRNLNAGIILSILAAITFGFYTVLTKSAVSKYGNFFTNSLSFLMGGLVLTIVNLLIG
nr:EamA family transporter [Candidatus Cloacimonadota bacterium]